MKEGGVGVSGAKRVGGMRRVELLVTEFQYAAFVMACVQASSTATLFALF